MDSPEGSNGKGPRGFRVSLWGLFMLVMCVHRWIHKTPGMTENVGAHFLPAIPSRDAESLGTVLDEK